MLVYKTHLVASCIIIFKLKNNFFFIKWVYVVSFRTKSILLITILLIIGFKSYDWQKELDRILLKNIQFFIKFIFCLIFCVSPWHGFLDYIIYSSIYFLGRRKKILKSKENFYILTTKNYIKKLKYNINVIRHFFFNTWFVRGLDSRFVTEYPFRMKILVRERDITRK